MIIMECHFDLWSIDFILGLLLCAEFNTIHTCIDKLSKFKCLIPCFKGEGKLEPPSVLIYSLNIFFTCLACLKWSYMIVICTAH